jgi:hemerythrin-like metal-binding protein
MAFDISWKPYYSVNNTELDNEHQKILRCVAELQDAIVGGYDAAQIRSILDFLVEYASTHFQHEEAIMWECEFPDLDEHRLIHNRMRQRTLELREESVHVSGQELLRFLKEWWIDHIQMEDKKYAPYMSVPVQ